MSGYLKNNLNLLMDVWVINLNLVNNSYLANLYKKGNLARRFPFFMTLFNLNNYKNLMNFG
ncbi:hypothetical protein EG340_07700 [Chryseobacterium indoltheticum]|uniref:Uncharacterized protein n=1 Tax=Chryseobacterium indoltheticum TaxID=254 RepID=A0A3G6MZH0_9FLAO|nr:hypothetical protein EG340_07700 [Chryseobacterium indoltheticum]